MKLNKYINLLTVVLSVYPPWLHSLWLFNGKTFAGSTYGFRLLVLISSSKISSMSLSWCPG